eukprot:ANDGO_05045.mRNA.1 hypothetical protein
MFKALDLKRGFFATMFSKAGFKAYGDAKKDGFKAKGLYGDALQLPGFLISSKGGSEFVFYHRGESSGDHGDLDGIFAAYDEYAKNQSSA